MSQNVHKLWLKVTAAIIVSFVPIFLLGTIPATSAPARLTLDILVWPPDGAQNFAAHEVRFMAALLAGFLAGWGATIWCLSSIYDAAPEAIRRAVLTGLVLWFVVDGVGSIASGTALNAGFNVIVLLLAAGPLWVPARGGTGLARGAS